MAMSPSSADGHHSQFIHRQSFSPQDGPSYANSREQPQPVISSLAPHPAGGISCDFNQARSDPRPLDLPQSHTANHNHRPAINNSHPTRATGPSDNPHLSHPTKKPSAQSKSTTGSNKKSLPGTRADQPTRPTQSAAELSSSKHPHPSSPAANPPVKKNGKPLAKCPFCGMTFKKLEHCQRHERTHTLARPYSCTVCLKTFARQDTLNRHLRLHSRSDGKTSINKSSPGQPSQAPASPSKQPPHILPSSPIRSNFDVLSVSGVPQPPFVSPTNGPRRDRGFSLSALEHSSLSGHLRRDPSMINNAPRQSISLPLQRHDEQFNHPHHHPVYPIRYNQAPQTSSQLSLEISSQPSESSVSYVYGEAMEARRGSWCPGGQIWSDMTLLAPDDPGPPLPSTRGYRHQPEHLSLGVANWSKNLTNTFGLVEAGIGPVPLSAPATCTNWGTSLIGSGAPESSNQTTGSVVGPRWETLPQYETQSHIHPSWSGLGRLDEEEQIKLEPEPGTNSTGTSQLLLSSPSQPGSFDQPNPIEGNCPTGSSSTEMPHEPSFETNQSVHWSFPPGGNLSDPYLTQLTHPASFSSSSDPLDCFGNVWQTESKNLGVDDFHPAYWNPRSICVDGPDGDRKPIAGSHAVLNPNGLPTKNPWEEIVELDF